MQDNTRIIYSHTHTKTQSQKINKSIHNDINFNNLTFIIKAVCFKCITKRNYTQLCFKLYEQVIQTMDIDSNTHWDCVKPMLCNYRDTAMLVFKTIINTFPKEILVMDDKYGYNIIQEHGL